MQDKQCGLIPIPKKQGLSWPYDKTILYNYGFGSKCNYENIPKTYRNGRVFKINTKVVMCCLCTVANAIAIPLTIFVVSTGVFGG